MCLMLLVMLRVFVLLTADIDCRIQSCHKILPVQSRAPRRKATLFISILRPFYWLLPVDKLIKVPPGIILGSFQLVEKTNRTSLVNHWPDKDSKRAAGQKPQMMCGSFILSLLC